MSSLSARPTPRTGRTIPAGLGGSRRNDARPETRAHASTARCICRHGHRRGRGGLDAPGELSVSEKVSLSAKLSVRRDGVPPSSSKDTVDDAAVVAPPSSSKDTVVVQLLKPSTHLTQPCWSAFSKHVRSFPGWTPKRRVATAEEKRAHGETRQSKCYFTDVSFNPKTFKKKSRDAAATKGQQTIAPPPAKKPKVMTEASNAPPAPKPEEAAKPPAAPATDDAEDKEVEDWYAKATTPPVPAS